MLRWWVPTLVALVACERDVGLADRDETERFTPGADRPPADLLFVVDDSPSMSEEQARLGQDLAVLLDQVIDADVDLHVGVVTTDLTDEDAGRFRDRMFTSADPGLDTTLAQVVDVGTRGGRAEQGLAVTLRALDGRNPGFPREDARVDVIYFSDEDDGSPEPYAFYDDALWKQLGPRLRAHGVVGDLPSGCFSPDGAADPATRYLDLVARTDGYEESICAPDFVQLLDRLGLDIAGIVDTFALQYVPDVDTIVVHVDGAKVASDPIDGWTYEPAPNAVVFHGPAIPEAGQEVVVDYIRLAGTAAQEP